MINIFKDKNKISIMLIVALLLTYIPLLFHKDYFNTIVKFDSNVLSNGEIVFLMILEIFTIASTVVLVLEALFKKRFPGLTNLLVFFALPIFILNLVFIRLNIIAMFGSFTFDNYRAILFILFNLISASIAGYKLYNKEYDIKSENILKQTLLILGYILLFSIPNNFFSTFFGTETGLSFEGFTDEHKYMLTVVFVVPFIAFLILKNKDYEFKRFALITASIAGVIQYYTYFDFNMTAAQLPIHLCNTAMILVPLALLTKNQKVFYFTYFVNVLGTLIAMILPNGSPDIFTRNAYQYWLNHSFAFFLPLLAVALGVFPRPELKQFKYAVVAFTIYFFSVAFINAHVSNFADVDYFFINKEFFIEKIVFVKPLRDNYHFSFQIGEYVYNFWPVYQLFIYVVYIFLMFIMWSLYKKSYQVIDHYDEFVSKLKEIKNKDKMFSKENSMSKDTKEPTYYVEVNGFSKQYKKDGPFRVNDMSFKIKPGTVVGFLGHNGAGKSTTIKSMIGLQGITKGSIKICGYDIERQPLLAKEHISYVPDNHALYENLTALEYINYVADLYNVDQKTRDEDINKYLELFELTHSKDLQIKTFSHGMKQKVSIISTILHNPKVWILDEPLNGLDPFSVFQIKQCMLEHAKKGNVVFFSSHIIDVAERVCDEIIIISGGKLRKQFKVEDVTKDGSTLEEVYIKEIGQDHILDHK